MIYLNGSSAIKSLFPLSIRAFLVVVAALVLATISKADTSADWEENGRPLPVPEIVQPSLDDRLPMFSAAHDAAMLKAQLRGSVPAILPDLVRRWVTEFQRYYPAITFDIPPPYGPPLGSLSPTLRAFLEGETDFAFMTRMLTAADRELFVKSHGYAPLEYVVLGGSHAHFGFVDALAVIVHRDNPLKEISLSQLDALYSQSGFLHHPNSISRWGELGLTGSWAMRPINVLGVPESIESESARAAYLRSRVFDVADQKSLWRLPEENKNNVRVSIPAQVANDRLAIGFTGLSHVASNVKTLSITDSTREGAESVAPNYDNVRRWLYPLTRPIFLLVAKPAGENLQLSLCEFLHFILSKNGQQVVLDQGVFLPLPAASRQYPHNLGMAHETCLADIRSHDL